MKRWHLPFLAAATLAAAGTASSADIDVMTQNQYLGADIAPLIAAIGTEGFNDAVVMALRQIAANRSQERFTALAALVSSASRTSSGCRKSGVPCIPAAPELNGLSLHRPVIADAFNDHLAGTLAASPRLSQRGLRAELRRLLVRRLSRHPVLRQRRPRLPAGAGSRRDPRAQRRRHHQRGAPLLRVSEDGCNFNVDLPLGALGSVERGSLRWTRRSTVGYRFFNTHLEVQGNALIPGEVQAAQAFQLIGTASPHCRPVGN